MDDEEEKEESVLLLLVEEDKMAIDLCRRQKNGSICKCFPRKMNKAGSLAPWWYITSFVAESSKGNKRSWPLPSSSISS